MSRLSVDTAWRLIVMDTRLPAKSRIIALEHNCTFFILHLELRFSRRHYPLNGSALANGKMRSIEGGESYAADPTEAD
jgi:hypothetical protein